MAREPDRHSIVNSLNGLGWPLIVGLGVCSIFYVLIFQGPLNTELAQRYFASHPVSYCVTAMFFVGLAALVLKLVDVTGQHLTLDQIVLDQTEDAVWSVDDCPRLRDQLVELPSRLRHSYLAQRLDESLDFIDRTGSAADLDEELKYLSDAGGARQQDSYALVRIITWATPMLGFLGTVIGITQALGELGSQSDLLASDPKTAMQALLSGLYVAFDTTALALSLSIVLMFVQFLVDRFESELLTTVDERARGELMRAFESEQVGSEPHLIVVQRMATAVMKTAEQLVRQQTEHWRAAIDQANGQWSELLSSSAADTRAALTECLNGSIDRFATRLAESTAAADEQMRGRWEQWQTALSDNARLLHAQQAEMVKQGETMAKVITAAGDVASLEKTLNDNLNALAGAKNFEETVMSLSAAIHLLSARQAPAGASSIELVDSPTQDRAA